MACAAQKSRSKWRWQEATATTGAGIGPLLLGILLIAAAAFPALSPARAAAALDLSRYRLDVAFAPDARTLTGTVAIDWRNTTGQPQEFLYFRLYPNAPHYEDGATQVSDIEIDGHEVDASLWSDQTVLEVELGRQVLAGDHAGVAMSFKTTVPATSNASFGILGGDEDDGWRLADWHPILAGWEDGSGWYLDSPTRFGDPTFAESATYDLELTAPDDYTVLGSGVTVEQEVDASTGLTTTTIETAPGRDLTLSLLPGASAGAIETTEQSIAGFTVRVSLPVDQAVPGLAGAIVDIAGETLPLYESWFGEYPERELDITTAPLVGASGVAWNGIVWLDVAAIVRDGDLSNGSLDALRFVLTHELAHQWIAGIVGSNNNDHGFMTEGLANILAVLAIRETRGVEDAERFLRSWVADGYRNLVESGNDGVADAPITGDSEIGARSRLMYGKGALGFEAIRQAIGDEAFLEGLHAYATEYRFRISDPTDLREAFETASGADLGMLWTFWFEDERTTVADIDALLDGFTNQR